MANGLDLVELLPDGVQPDGGEDLAAPRARLRFASPRLWHAMVAVAVLGGVLVADGPARPRPPATSAPYVYRGDSHCPMGIRCQVQTRPRQGLWASYHRLFVGTRATGGGVWYEPASGVVFIEELDAVGISDPALTISLREQRIDHGGSIAFGPTVDFLPRSRDDAVPSPWRRGVLRVQRYMVVVGRRGPWLVTAALSGPNTVLLPFDAALHWVANAPLP